MTSPGNSLTADFDALYRGESLWPEGNPLRAVFRDIVPWDIGGPQPKLVELVTGGGVRGQVLDAGCGLGESALYLASVGYRVTAFDYSPAAIRRASARAEALELRPSFLLADATALRLPPNTFDTLLDNGLLHSLEPAGRAAYLTSLRQAAAPGARLYIACWATDAPAEIRPPHRYDADEIRRTLRDSGWTISEFARTRYAANPALTRDVLREAMAITGASDGQEFVDDLEADEHGRLLMPVWWFTAEVTP